MAAVNLCPTWRAKYPNSTANCTKSFPDDRSFQLGYIGSLAAVPFGQGSSDASFNKRQRIAQSAWLLIIIALPLGLVRKRAFRYSQRSSSQVLMEPFALASKLLAIAFASLFGILIGDLNPNSNLLEVLVWIIPGLLYHRFSPELVQDNCLVGLLINTVQYLPGLITAAFSIWSAVDFSALVPQEAWTPDEEFWRGTSLAVRILATITVVVAILRQMFGAYTNLVLAAKRKILNRELLGLRDTIMDVEGVADAVILQRKQEEATLGLYNSVGLPRHCVDLDWIAMFPHAILVLVEAGTFGFIGVAVFITTKAVLDKTDCFGRDIVPVPSFFTLQQAVACRINNPCEGIEINLPFCQWWSFVVAFATGIISMGFSSLSLLWLFYQLKIVHDNHENRVQTVRNKVSVEDMRETFDEQAKDLLGTYFTLRRDRTSWLPWFLLLTVWQPWQLRAAPLTALPEPPNGVQSPAVMDGGEVELPPIDMK